MSVPERPEEEPHPSSVDEARDQRNRGIIIALTIVLMAVPLILGALRLLGYL